MRVIKVGNDVVAQVLARKRKPTAQKIVNTALNGTSYVQTTGSAIWRYEVSIYCDTPEKRALVDEACYNGADVTLIYDDLTEIGYIEDVAVTWKEWTDEHGVGSFTLLRK